LVVYVIVGTRDTIARQKEYQFLFTNGCKFYIHGAGKAGT